MKPQTQTTALLLLLAVLLSCTKEEANQFDTPEFAQYACQIIPKGEVQAASPRRPSSVSQPGSLLGIELTESGLYVLTQLLPGEDKPQYTSGRYSVKGNYSATGRLYTLSGYGTLEFDEGGTSEVSVSVKPVDGPAQTILATIRKATQSSQMYRSWNVDKTRVTVKGWTTASADFEGCNFHEIAEFLIRNSHKAPGDVPEGYGLRSVTFTGTHSVIFIYTDDTLDMGEFSLSGDSISYRWNNDTMGFTFLTDEAKVEFLDGKCLLRVDADIQHSTTSGSVTFVLSPIE